VNFTGICWRLIIPITDRLSKWCNITAHEMIHHVDVPSCFTLPRTDSIVDRVQSEKTAIVLLFLFRPPERSTNTVERQRVTCFEKAPRGERFQRELREKTRLETSIERPPLSILIGYKLCPVRCSNHPATYCSM